MRKMMMNGLIVVCFLSLCFLSGVLFPKHVQAGKYPYPELLPHIAHEVREILIKHGLPVKHDRENGWSYFEGIPGRYTIYFYQADKIPQAAKIDTIRFCMDLYEEGGRKELFRIKMFYGTHAEKLKSFFGLEPFFELTIGGNN